MDTPAPTPIADPLSPDTTPTPDHPLLTSYLADHDAPCPHCRYNLRGVSGSTCPECGKPIELALSSPSRFGSRGLFLLAALLVVLIGGSIAATRQWRDVHATATRGSFSIAGTSLRLSTTSGFTVVSSSARTAASPTSGTVTLTSPTITINSAGAASVTTPSAVSTPSTTQPPTAPRATTPRLATAFSATSFSPKAPFATFTPVAPMPAAWSSVTIGQWSLLGLWSLLALAALAALALLLILRARKSSPGLRWVRTLSAASISLLALFGAAHVTLFITDLLH